MPRARTRFYLFNFRNKGGGNLSHSCPSSAKRCTSVYLANIHSLSTSVPGSSAPARPSALLPCAPGDKELLPKCIRHCWGSSTARVSPVQGEELLGLEETSGQSHPCPSPPAPRLCYKEPSAHSPHPWPLAFEGILHCLCKFFSMSWASLPSAGGGVCFPDSTGISVCDGEGNHAGEGRKPQTALQEYLKLGVPKLFFFSANCCWRKNLSYKAVAVTIQLCCVVRIAWKWELRPGKRCWAAQAVAVPEETAQEIFVIIILFSISVMKEFVYAVR